MHVKNKKAEYAIKFTAREKAELIKIKRNDSPLEADEIYAETLVSLISPGTEIVGVYNATHYQITPDSYPMSTGYASVSKVVDVGRTVSGLKPGDLVLGGCHQSHQRGRYGDFVRVPEGLSPELAVFGRIIKISIPALIRSIIRPPEVMVIAGLGVVGILAAQLGRNYGYQVVACDPSEKRREIARGCGLADVLAKIPVCDPEYAKKTGLGLDCSGHEQAVLDLCDIVRPWGEVSMVGVPWFPRTTILAQKILHSVFYNFVSLRSGWECAMPPFPDVHCDQSHLAAAMRWLADGRFTISDKIYRKENPADPQKYYQEIMNNCRDELTVMFDWRML